MRARGAHTRWDYAERRRRERNYRLMFKCALVFCAIGVAVAIFGGAEAIIAGDASMFSIGLMLAIISAVSAWTSVDSTVRIIELDMDDDGED